MEADSNKRWTTKKVFKRYYWFVIGTVRVGSVSTFGLNFVSSFFLNAQRFDFFLFLQLHKIFCIQSNQVKNIVTFKLNICTKQDFLFIKFKVVNVCYSGHI